MKKTVFSVIAAASVVANMDVSGASPSPSNESSPKTVAIPAAAAGTVVTPAPIPVSTVKDAPQSGQLAPKANKAEISQSIPPATSTAPTPKTAETATAIQEAPFQAFTGKVIKNKVRLRLEPNVESEIVKELNRNDMFVIVGEENSFYAIKPPVGTKAYVYRTFVLEGVIDGKRVNVRLKPDTNAPVIAQLNAGDPAKGVPYPLNNKWVEIDPPASVKFYIAKEFVERVGDSNYLSTIERLRDESSRQINSTYLLGQSELRKPFDEINIDKVVAAYDKIISTYTECSQEVGKAKELRQLIRDAYTQKKIAHLETKANAPAEAWTQKNSELSQQIETYQSRLQELEQKLQAEAAKATAQVAAIAAPEVKEEPVAIAIATPPAVAKVIVTEKMAVWEPLEESYFQEWNREHEGSATKEEFYASELDKAVQLKGVLEPYSKPVKNKPGDFLLLDSETRMPVAYLYSTSIDLQSYVGKQIIVQGAKRPNNHFAYPAYFVLSAK